MARAGKRVRTVTRFRLEGRPNAAEHVALELERASRDLAGTAYYTKGPIVVYYSSCAVEGRYHVRHNHLRRTRKDRVFVLFGDLRR